MFNFVKFIGQIVCFFEPNAWDDFAKILWWLK